MSTAIAKLIQDLRGDRSYDQLSRDCGGAPTPARIHQLANKQQNTFPSPETIRGLAKGLGVRPLIIAHSFGTDLDLWSERDLQAPALNLPEGAEHLTTGQRSAVVGMIRELVRCNEHVSELQVELNKAHGQNEGGEQKRA